MAIAIGLITLAEEVLPRTVQGSVNARQLTSDKPLTTFRQCSDKVQKKPDTTAFPRYGSGPHQIRMWCNAMQSSAGRTVLQHTCQIVWVYNDTIIG